MSGDGGREEGPGPARRVGTALAILLFVALAGAAVRQGARLNPLDGTDGGPPGGLEVRAAVDTQSETEALSPPAVGEWEVVPRSGLSPRSDPVAVWTGTEVFLWGGWAREDRTRTFSDGASYDPVSREWVYLMEGPPRGWQEGAIGLWTGTEVLVLGGRNGIGREPLAQAYDPARRTWRPLAQPPAGRWLWRTAVWTGTHVVVVEEGGPGTASTLRYDLEADSWRQGATLSPMDVDLSSRAAWLDGQMFVSGQVIESPRLMLQAFDPFGTTWRRGRGAPPSQEWRALLAADPSADSVLVAGPVPGGDPGFLVARWNPRDGWHPLPEVPPALRGARLTALFATPAGPLLWPDGPVPPSVLSGGLWRPLPRAPRDKNFGEAVVWTGQGLFVWGGHTEEHSAGGAIFRPGAAPEPEADDPARPVWPGEWETLPPLPASLGEPRLFRDRGLLHVVAREPEGGARRIWRLEGDGWGRLTASLGAAPTACVANTDGRVSVAGIEDGGWQVSLTHLRADVSVAVAPPPIPAEGMLGCASWRGRAVVVTGTGLGYHAAMLDPETREWETLPSPPGRGFLIDVLAEGAAADAALLLVLDTTVNRLRDGAWTMHDTPRNQFPTDLPAVHWTGEELLVWGGRIEAPVRTGWSWKPDTGLWRQMPAAWFGGTAERTPQAGGGGAWLVWGQRSQGNEVQEAGVYEPGARRWRRLPPSRAGSPVTAAQWDDGVVVLHADGEIKRFRPTDLSPDG